MGEQKELMVLCNCRCGTRRARVPVREVQDAGTGYAARVPKTQRHVAKFQRDISHETSKFT